MDEQAKKSILRKIPYGLYVIGVKGKDALHGFTGSFLSQCSMKPPRVMLGVRHDTHSLELIRESKVFTVNFVSKNDRKVLEQFFKPAPPTGNRFGDVSFSLKRTGAPVLDCAIQYLECEVKGIFEGGDHFIVVGEVIEAEIRKDEAPIIMSDTPWHYGG